MRRPLAGDDAYPAATFDSAEVRECRAILGPSAPAPGPDAEWLAELEQYESAEEAGAARDLATWGGNPWWP